MFTMSNKDFGQYVRKIRIDKGGEKYWSLRSVASRSGVSDSYLSQIENGKIKSPSFDIIRRLAEALKHPYLDLLDKAGYLPKEIPPELNIMKLLTDEVIEILNDPLAMKAATITHGVKKSTEPALAQVLEQLSAMDPDRIAALLKVIDP